LLPNCTRKCRICGKVIGVHEYEHQWKFFGSCEKSCINCGTARSMHDYERVNEYKGTDDYYDDWWYICKKCGHRKSIYAMW
jgi:hypothetical protein